MEDKQKLLDYLQKKLRRNKADDVVLAFEGGKKTQIKFVNNNIVATNTWDAMSIGIFASFKKKIVMTNLEEFNNGGVDQKIDQLLDFAKSAEPNEKYKGIAKGPFEYKEVEDGYDDKIEYLSDESVDIVQTAISEANDNGAERVSGVFEYGNTFSNLITSNNVKCEDN